MKIKIIVFGANGKMGRELGTLLKNDSSIDVFQIHRKSFQESELIFKRLEDLPKMKFDVLVDFSLPDGTLSALHWCLENHVPFVSGTTGLLDSHLELLQKASSLIPVLYSANMSIGIALFKKMIDQLAPLGSTFDFQITEVHHKKKKDAPSGTAIQLQKNLESAVQHVCASPLSVRGGGVLGLHQLWCMGEEEILSIEHQALSRTVFARGALRCAYWILNQKPGFYSLEDCLGI